MNRYTILGAVGATFLALAGCTPGEEVLTKTEADVQLDETTPAAPPVADFWRFLCGGLCRSSAASHLSQNQYADLLV